MERVKFDMEFLFKASPAILYKFMTTPSCLVRWFCDEVDIEADEFSFSWEGYEEKAELVDDIEEERLRFIWEDAEDGEYLEFRFSKSPVTNENPYSRSQTLRMKARSMIKNSFGKARSSNFASKPVASGYLLMKLLASIFPLFCHLTM